MTNKTKGATDTVEVVCDCGRVFDVSSSYPYPPKHFNRRGATTRRVCYGGILRAAGEQR